MIDYIDSKKLYSISKPAGLQNTLESVASLSDGLPF